MLTVKYISKDGRHEIFSAETVHYVPDTPDAFGTAGLYIDVDCELDLSGAYPVTARRVIPVTRARSAEDAANPVAYIMNANGATVAQYSM